MSKFKDKFDQLEKMKNSFVEEALVYLKDKDEPLSERWSVYCNISCYLDIDSMYADIPTVDCYYDDLYIDRYATLRYSRLPSILEEKRTEEQINEIKEWAMSTGDAGCINDW